MKFLVVDDEYAALTKMNILLSDYGQCDTATNGKQALEMHAAAVHNQNPYDLITIDIDMPGINGIDVLIKICDVERKKKTTPAKKIMISASGTKKNIMASVKNKCDSFIVKPVKRDIIEKKMEEMGIQKSGQSPS